MLVTDITHTHTHTHQYAKMVSRFPEDIVYTGKWTKPHSINELLGQNPTLNVIDDVALAISNHLILMPGIYFYDQFKITVAA